jgi:flagellar basal body-associated protein FliL
MSLAKNINEKLDEILNLRSEIKRMKKELNKKDTLINPQTGKKATQADALKLVEEIINQIKDDINELTNHGQNVRDIFTNEFYINDNMEDKRIARNNNNK